MFPNHTTSVPFTWYLFQQQQHSNNKKITRHVIKKKEEEEEQSEEAKEASEQDRYGRIFEIIRLEILNNYDKYAKGSNRKNWKTCKSRWVI